MKCQLEQKIFLEEASPDQDEHLNPPMRDYDRTILR